MTKETRILVPLHSTVAVQKNIRSFKDGRKKVDRYIFAYRRHCDEWRRSIEVKSGSPAPIPPSHILIVVTNKEDI